MNGVRRGDVQWEREPLTRGSLRDKKMAIGGTNGIGRALALLFAANGAEAVVVGRTFRERRFRRLDSALKNHRLLPPEVRSFSVPSACAHCERCPC
jgi:predicted dinucleotide-binding enzyme